ncbi:hypothetical protein RRG08_038894 [Elysia crispata]|uniref:Uncharacterized protein n=1 Tax=Elysia crispata TaxID=231223 RepID=A0AAE0Y7T6_9GAST|nr:hypothetical protein RRG08_038894 [Elysia crispata]
MACLAERELEAGSGLAGGYGRHKNHAGRENKSLYEADNLQSTAERDTISPFLAARSAGELWLRPLR